MRRRGLAESTIHVRLALVRRWWQFVDFKPFAVKSWRTVEAFIDARSLTVARRYGEISALHMFYRWAMREGLTGHDPTALVERPRIRGYLPRPIHDTDLALALAMSTGPMHAAIALAATSGLRCVELCRLRWDDLTESTVRVLGKGHKERVVPLHPDAAAALERLDRPDGFVFPWREDRRGVGVRASAAINRFLHSIGVDATAHQLRHWCATAALAATGDLRAVQELLGHSSPATTSIYTKLDPSRIAHVVDAIRLPVGPPDRSPDGGSITSPTPNRGGTAMKKRRPPSAKRRQPTSPAPSPQPRRPSSGTVTWTAGTTGQSIDPAEWGAKLDFGLLRPLLVLADDPTLAAAVAAYDAALAHAASLSTERPAGRAEVEAAYRAEQMAAALERRAAALSWADVQTAEADEADHAAEHKAARLAIGRRNHELDTAMRQAAGALLHVLAVERAGQMQGGADPARIPGVLYTLYSSTAWPELAYGAGYYASKGAPKWWWPLILGGWEQVAYLPQPDVRFSWNEWCWAQLARPKRKGYRIEGGRLQFADLWPDGRALPGGPDNPAPFASRGVEPGTAVMLGVGPSGEQGVTEADLRWRLQPVVWHG
jgi:site-specific recombinase XerC